MDDQGNARVQSTEARARTFEDAPPAPRRESPTPRGPRPAATDRDPYRDILDGIEPQARGPEPVDPDEANHRLSEAAHEDDTAETEAPTSPVDTGDLDHGVRRRRRRGGRGRGRRGRTGDDRDAPRDRPSTTDDARPLDDTRPVHDARPVHNTDRTDDAPLAVITPPAGSGIVKIEVRRNPPPLRTTYDDDTTASELDGPVSPYGEEFAAQTESRPPRRAGSREPSGRSSQGTSRGPSQDDSDRDAAPSGSSSRGPRRTRPEQQGVHHFFSPERLEECQHAIGYHFRDIRLLENALTHSSIKSDDRPSYERLEFLGDSVVGLIIAEYLYLLRPDFDEGELTKVKSLVVSTEGLANAAIKIGLDGYLAVGRGILMKNSVPRSLIADVFEGVIGAVFIDRGYEAASLYVLDQLLPFLDEALNEPLERNFKSVLQKVAQRDLGETPHYEVLREWGPDRTRQYEVVAVLGRRRFAAGKGPTKRDAEQAAAKVALSTILSERGAESPRRRRTRRDTSRRRSR